MNGRPSTRASLVPHHKVRLSLLKGDAPLSAERSALSVVTFAFDRHRYSGEQLANVLTSQGFLCYYDEDTRVSGRRRVGGRVDEKERRGGGRLEGNQVRTLGRDDPQLETTWIKRAGRWPSPFIAAVAPSVLAVVVVLVDDDDDDDDANVVLTGGSLASINRNRTVGAAQRRRCSC